MQLPRWSFSLAQAVIGCLVARSFTPTLFYTIANHPLLFVSASLSALMVATSLGMVLTRLRVLPGSTVLWGSFPGAATVMVVLSESYGADMRLVALMQYLRIVVVATTASLVARLSGIQGGPGQHLAWFAPVVWPSFAVVVALVLVGGFVAPRLRVPAASLLVPMVLATVLQDIWHMRIELPQLLLAATYVIMGWTIGLRFTRDVFSKAFRALPLVLGSIAILVATCAGIGCAISRVSHLDMLTAYLATSPGGADSVAIIAAGTNADMSLVMAIQMGRFLAVLVLGPALAKCAAQLTGATPKGT